ncbi:MAG: preprotein translocase subunit SecE [Bacteroidetes bacterium]|jgi:preprotein translocase subunit SecE|nr:preprotein translocase subunit SecE [Bacteroidota bacterium]
MNKIRAFFNGYYDELVNKVSWPKTEELQSNTVTVLVASLVIALVIALMDVVFNYGLQFVYELFA